MPTKLDTVLKCLVYICKLLKFGLEIYMDHKGFNRDIPEPD